MGDLIGRKAPPKDTGAVTVCESNLEIAYEAGLLDCLLARPEASPGLPQALAISCRAARSSIVLCHQDLSVKSDTSVDGSHTVTSCGQMAGQARDARHGKSSTVTKGDYVREPDRAKSAWSGTRGGITLPLNNFRG